MIYRVLGCTIATLFLAVACAAEMPRAGEGPGTLVIAGGAVRDDNEAVYSAFLEAMPDSASGTVAVISAASIEPVKSAATFRETLEMYGIPDQRIAHVRLAVRDDETTPEDDESLWSANAREPAEIAKIEQADAIWFTGGDQSRLTAVLYDQAGRPTPMLEAIRARLSAGAVVGGTSAGAAIMSDPMITGGDSMAALLDKGQADEKLTTGRGLGFFPLGLVDQHFHARARLGRSALALGRVPPERRIAFGVDENTALVYRFGAGTVSIVGTGNVTIVDGRSASWSRVDDRITIEGLVLSVLCPGDRLAMETGEFHPASYLKSAVGDEGYDFAPGAGGGMAVPTGRLSRMLGRQLLDNKGARKLDRYSFVVSAASGKTQEDAESAIAEGILFRFVQTPESVGYRGYDSDGNSRYTVLHIDFSIMPFRSTINRNLQDRGDTANE